MGREEKYSRGQNVSLVRQEKHTGFGKAGKAHGVGPSRCQLPWPSSRRPGELFYLQFFQS